MSLAQAEQELTLAFYHCHLDAHRNQELVQRCFSAQLEAYVCIASKRRILTCLIPLRILRGHLPSKELLERFPVLDELFSPFIAAIRVGDISAYDTALERWEDRLVEVNLWITIEKARELCIRGLFRRVYVSIQPAPCTSSSSYRADGWLQRRVPESPYRCSISRSGYQATTFPWRWQSALLPT